MLSNNFINNYHQVIVSDTLKALFYQLLIIYKLFIVYKIEFINFFFFSEINLRLSLKTSLNRY